MIIAINSTNFIKSASNHYYYNYFVTIALSKPEHQFIFIIGAAINESLVYSKNITHIISYPPVNNLLVWKLWLNYALPRIARKNKADVLFNTSGVCSLRTTVPQYLFVGDLSFIHSPQFFSKQQVYFLKKNLSAFLTKATTIVTFSTNIKKEIIQRYLIDEKKISCLQLIAGDDYQPMDWNQKEAMKEKYTSGKEYFLFSGEINNRYGLVNLLKAFSFFKTRQKSNMQLIITANTVSPKDPFLEDFKTYKYRKEVNLLFDLPEKDHAKICAGAYAVVYPVFTEGTALFILQAMQCEVPVITTHTAVLHEIAADTALYADPANFESIADKMMLIFKDENKRSEVIKKGKTIVENYHAKKTNESWWASVINMYGQL